MPRDDDILRANQATARDLRELAAKHVAKLHEAGLHSLADRVEILEREAEALLSAPDGDDDA